MPKRYTTILLGAALIMASSLTFQTALTCPPHPDLQAQIDAGLREAPFFYTNQKALQDQGVSSTRSFRLTRDGAVKLTATNAPAVSGQFRALAILVQFTDHSSAVAGTYFDSLLFDSVGRSVRNYYSEVSYAQLDIVTANLPSSLGWRTAPQTYAYYVDGENGTGAYPQNCQKLTEDLVDQIDPLVNFSQYDNDDDGYVDVLIIIHAGTGAEMTGSPNDIWSHKWGIIPRLKDGVYISDYTVQPELWVAPGDMTIGVYSHELGHAFGLPDLYDTDASASHGPGTWDLMSYGSWNGPGGMGGSPSHPSAWSRIAMGFATPTNVTVNLSSQTITSVESGGPIFRLWTSGAASDEYFLVENRQKTGYDAYLAGSGLLIWHIDDAKATYDNTDNTEEWWPGLNAAEHYRVALEQADGLWELEKKLDYGDGNDPFPGGLARRTFDAVTTPNSNSYLDGTSFVKVDNISNSAATMTADLIVGFAADVEPDDPPTLPTSITLNQNYPNPFNPSTTISFEVSRSDDVALEIFNIVGQRVRLLLEERVGAGETTITWDGLDEHGQPVSSGIYLYRLSAQAGNLQTRKMVLLK